MSFTLNEKKLLTTKLSNKISNLSSGQNFLNGFLLAVAILKVIKIDQKYLLVESKL